MSLSLSDIDSELDRRNQVGNPSIDEINAELARRGISENPVSETISEAAKIALTQGPIQTPLNLIDPENTQKMNEVLGTPYRGLRGIATTVTSGLQRGAEATTQDFKPQGIKEHLADMIASIGDPRQIALGPATEEVLKTAVIPLAKGVGRQLARIPNIMAGVPAEDVMMTAEKPLEVLTSKTAGKSGKLFQKAKENVLNFPKNANEPITKGVTDLEERLIAGIGDPSGYKRVADQMYKKLAREGPESLTTGQLLAWKKSASELARKVKGSGEALYTQDALKAQSILDERALSNPSVRKVLETQSDVSLSKARQKFLSLLPRNKGKGDAVLRGMLQLGTAGVSGPAALAFSPISYLPPTLAAGAINKGLNVLGRNPAIRQTLMGILSQLMASKNNK